MDRIFLQSRKQCLISSLKFQIINQRNVYLVYPRNFGTSDRHEEFDLEEQADDALRFMYENQISTAAVGGHGIGAKVALALGCYHGKYVHGYVGLDSAPVDHRIFESFQDIKNFVKFSKDLNLDRSMKEIEFDLKKGIYVRVAQNIKW